MEERLAREVRRAGLEGVLVCRRVREIRWRRDGDERGERPRVVSVEGRAYDHGERAVPGASVRSGAFSRERSDRSGEDRELAVRARARLDGARGVRVLDLDRVLDLALLVPVDEHREALVERLARVASLAVTERLERGGDAPGEGSPELREARDAPSLPGERLEEGRHVRDGAGAPVRGERPRREERPVLGGVDREPHLRGERVEERLRQELERVEADRHLEGPVRRAGVGRRHSPAEGRARGVPHERVDAGRRERRLGHGSARAAGHGEEKRERQAERERAHGA